MVRATALRVVVTAGSTAACMVAVHTALNLRHLITPSPAAPDVLERIDVLIPARNEAAHVEATVRSVLAQTGVRALGVSVLDDGSTDGTGDLLEALAADDERLVVVRGADEPPPAGWLGKPWACSRLAAESGAAVLVFVDADVVLHPQAIRAVVATLRDHDLAMVAPYPYQEARTWLERLVQPLVTWSWVATLPLGWSQRSTRTSLSAANGQFIVMDAVAYRTAGGHESVRAEVIEDVALMRATRAAGLRTATVDGSTLATCRMYDGAGAVVDGYAKSLWAAFNGPVGSIAVNVALIAVYVLPPVAAVLARDPRTRRAGAIGYAAGVASRTLVARRTGEPLMPDGLAHPASIAAFVGLNAVSWYRHARGTNTWKDRPVRAMA